MKLYVGFDGVEDEDFLMMRDGPKYLDALLYIRESLQQIKASDIEEDKMLHIDEVADIISDSLLKARVEL